MMYKKDSIKKKDLSEEINKGLDKLFGTVKKRKAKDKHSAKKTLGAMQANHKEEIREYVLHMRKITTDWKQLANGTYVGKSKCGCIFEVRPSHTKTTVRYLQSISRGPRCRFLPQDVTRNWLRSNGKTTTRPKSEREIVRSLFKLD